MTGGVINFLKCAIWQSQERFMISDGKQHLMAHISFDKQKQLPYTFIHRKQYLLKEEIK
jgi:hypothetical protein